MKLISFKRSTTLFPVLLALFLISGFSINTVEAQEDGEKLFKSYCASCHSPGANQLVGPGLAGVYDKYEREWLYKWIKNSQALIESGDEQAVAVYEQYNKVLKPAQPVNNSQIDAILDYIKEYKPPVADNGAGVEVTEVASSEDEGMSIYTILGIIVVFLIVIIVFRKVQYIMDVANARDKGEEVPEETTLIQAVGISINSNKTIFALLGIVCLALFAKGGWDSALTVGVYTGYEPEQPIKFSHKLHAGQNGIDCNYCHSSASYS